MVGERREAAGADEIPEFAEVVGSCDSLDRPVGRSEQPAFHGGGVRGEIRHDQASTGSQNHSDLHEHVEPGVSGHLVEDHRTQHLIERISLEWELGSGHEPQIGFGTETAPSALEHRGGEVDSCERPILAHVAGELFTGSAPDVEDSSAVRGGVVPADQRVEWAVERIEKPLVHGGDSSVGI